MNLRQLDPTGRRAVWAFIVIIAVILIIAAIGYFGGNWESTPP